MTFFSAVLILLLVMDPLGNIPVFLSVLKPVPITRHRWVIIREMLVALLILLLFLFFGRYILIAMHLSTSALSIAGGLILLIISIKMIFPDYNLHPVSKSQESEPFIVPLAVPMIAGPTTMAMVMLFSTRFPHDLLKWSGALLVAWLVTVVVLMASSVLRRLLRERGIIAVERLMGMILLVMSVQMLLSGVRTYFH